MSAKPYATSFTFDPVDGTICQTETEQCPEVVAMAYGKDDPRTQATCKLMADAPGALVECLEALKRLESGAKRFFEDRVPSDSELANEDFVSPITQARAAILRAETVLGIEKGKP